MLNSSVFGSVEQGSGPWGQVSASLRKQDALPPRASFAPWIAALVLLGAAFLKTYQYFRATAAPAGFLDWAPLRFLVIEIEVALGMALVCGIRAGLSRLASLVLFGFFVVLNLSQAALGARTCACGFDLNPWLMAVLDLGLLTLLWYWRPAAQQASPLRFALAGSVLTLPAFAGLLGPNLDSYPRLVLSSPVVELGRMTQGQSRAFSLALSNVHDRPVVLHRIESDCSCLKAENLPWQLEPFQKAGFPLSLDLASEPGFTGNLEIEFEAPTETGQGAFAARVRTQVDPLKP